MHLSQYVKAYPCPDQVEYTILYSTKRSAMVKIPDHILTAARDRTLNDRDRDTLARLGFLVPDLAEERQEMRDLFVHANRQYRVFNGIVVLNLDCNLACAYCYEDNFRGTFYMQQETADLLVDTLTRNQIDKGRDVKLSFYGGEPLLSLGLIKDISTRLGAAARAKGVTYRFSMITNGTLLNRKTVEELLPLGFTGAKITLDGPRTTHDVSRPFLSGNGSYDAILKNVAEIAGLITLHLGGNFTRENYRSFPPLLDELLAKGVTPDKVARILFVPVVQKSGEKSSGDFNSGCLCSYEPWYFEASTFLREETLKRGFAAPKIRMSSCTVEYESNMVVNYDGALYKCPAFMSNPALQVGTLESGVSDYRESHNMDVWRKDECLSCAYLPLCFGGCKQMSILRTGSMDDVDCRKEYFDACLETLIRQDLTYQKGRN